MKLCILGIHRRHTIIKWLASFFFIDRRAIFSHETQNNRLKKKCSFCCCCGCCSLHYNGKTIRLMFMPIVCTFHQQSNYCHRLSILCVLIFVRRNVFFFCSGFCLFKWPIRRINNEKCTNTSSPGQNDQLMMMMMTVLSGQCI